MIESSIVFDSDPDIDIDTEYIKDGARPYEIQVVDLGNTVQLTKNN